jgi:hypothetical protein
MKLQEKMFQCVESWKKSGKTKVDFLKDTDISVHKLNYWLDKYSVLEAVVNKTNSNEFSDFQEIGLPSFAENFEDKRMIKKLLELSTPSGLKITIFEQCLV